MSTTIIQRQENPTFTALKAKHGDIAATVRATVAGADLPADSQAEALAWIDAMATVLAHDEQAIYRAHNVREATMRRAAETTSEAA